MRRLCLLLVFVVGCASHRAAPVDHAADPWQALADGNHRFMRGEAASRDVVSSRKELVAGQHPRVVVLACADSRVAPEIVFDAGLGELFVVRVAGNVADPAALGSLEYGVEHVHAELLVVLGHENCGAVAAAQEGGTLPTMNLEALVARIKPALAEAGSGDPVEANVRHSASAILAESPLLAHAVAEGHLRVVCAVYHLESGEVTLLAP